MCRKIPHFLEKDFRCCNLGLDGFGDSRIKDYDDRTRQKTHSIFLVSSLNMISFRKTDTQTSTAGKTPVFTRLKRLCYQTSRGRERPILVCSERLGSASIASWVPSTRSGGSHFPYTHGTASSDCRPTLELIIHPEGPF